MKKIMKKFKKNGIVTVVALAFVFGLSSVAQAATTPDLGVASTFGVLSSTFTNSNTPPQTIVVGDIGYTVAGAPTTPVALHTGTVFPEDATHAQAGLDQAVALANLNAETCTSIGTNVDLNAIIIPGNTPGVFPPGCYSSSGTMDIVLGTTVTLDANAVGGDGGDVWIFRSGGALTTGANSLVVLANGANASNVFWTPNGTASIGANASLSATPTFVGTIIADAGGSTGINLGHFANLAGRALAFGHTVTTDANTITVTATINVVKVVINDDGGTNVIADFPLFVDATSVISGFTNTFSAGTYTVTETTNPAYTSSFSGVGCTGGVVNLSPGNVVLCTITNDDIAVTPPPSGGGSSSGSRPRVPPLINVVKVPTPLALPSGPGPVTYTYTLTNIGTVGVEDITMVGDTCSPIVLVSGDTDGDSRLDLNETWIFSCSTTLSATHTNTVTATGWANGISAVDVASATVVVGDAIPPLIHVTKVPNPIFLPTPGGMVVYTNVVTNPGIVPLSNVSLIDDKCGPVNFVSGDINGDARLDTNEAWIYTCQTNLTANTTNTVMAEGQANGMTATDFAIVTVAVSIPGLPNTGFAPMSTTTLILAGILAIVLISLILFLRKKTLPHHQA